MATKLTTKQERFAQLVASGMTQSDAYRDAYDASRLSDKSVNELSAVLAKHIKVTSRVNELKAITADDSNLTREWIVEQARDVLADTRASKEHGAAVQALKLLTTLGGFDKQTLEHTGAVVVMQNVVVDGEVLDFGVGHED